ncbi:MAG TPA: AraC family transcriptional regulator [Ktedonobacterales bacterium]|nr:AraC family transcriptional regulator [Ktedonobacterales bacterium]
MSKPLAVAQQRALHAPTEDLTTPLLYLSSAGAGWEGLVAQAFHEPKELEGWIESARSDISLVLFAGGTMHIERRQAGGPWRGADIHHGELILNAGGGPSYEVRWKSLSSAPTQTLHLHLSTNLFARTAQEVADVDPTRLKLIGRSGLRDPLLSQISLSLWRELEQPGPGGALYVQTATQMLAVHLLRQYTAVGDAIKEPTRGLTHQQTRRVLEYVQAHLSETLSLETLAQQTGYTPYHFTRLFRQGTGESPHQFVLRLRIEQARRLLAETSLPLAEIAAACGFAHQSHLTQVFKRHLGLTPRAYRRDRSIRADF